MAKIAVASEHRPPTSRQLAAGHGWTMSEVLCHAGPLHAPFEEQHGTVSIAVVVSGTFQYRTSTGNVFMTPGCVLLGNAGDSFCCSHEHGTGDRCVSVYYDAACWDAMVSGAEISRSRFSVPRIPPVRALAAVSANVLAFRSGAAGIAADELSVELAGTAARIASGGLTMGSPGPPAATLSRVSRVVRMMDEEPGLPHEIRALSGVARLSPYHFLRAFQAVTGTTPHQYLLRLRLRRAALRLRTEAARVLDIALECGFGDVSNFNRAFRAEFGMSPRLYRKCSESTGRAERA